MNKTNPSSTQPSIILSVQRFFCQLFNHTSMRSKLVFLYVSSLIIIISLMVLVVQSMGYGILEQQTTAQLTALAASKASQISSLMEQDYERTNLIASRTQMRDSLIAFSSSGGNQSASRERIMDIIMDASASVDSIRNIDILNTQGIIVASTSIPRVNQDLTEDLSFKTGLTGRYQSDFFWDPLDRPYYFYSMPLHHTFSTDENPPQVIGVLRVELSLERLMAVLSDHTGLGQTGEIILVSQDNGQILALNPLRNSEHVPSQPLSIATAMPYDNGIQWDEQVSFSYVNTIMAYSPIDLEHHTWGIITSVSTEEMTAPYQTLFQYFILFTIALLIFGSIAILAGIRNSFINIEKLLEGARLFGNGSLDHRIELAQKDELGKLADSFNDMAGKLKEIQDQMMHLSFKDQLTGLGNRRFYEEELIRLDTPRHLPLTILMGDVNGLKLTNDAFGHSTGDELLRQAAAILREECRKQDIVCRVGGDEFILLLPNTTENEVNEMIFRIKNKLGQTKVANIDLSISFGYDIKAHAKLHIQEILESAEEKMYSNKLSESKAMRQKTIEVILNSYFQDRAERRHAHGVAALCEGMGKALNLSTERLSLLKTAGLLHDLGNIAIDPSLLQQKNPLGEKDWSEIKRHPEIGYRILSGASEYQEVAELLLGHHEHWDGTGYPRKLKGEEISIESRIIAIAEAYDTMTHDQPYSEAMANQEAVDELKNQSGKQFDPALVSLFVYKVL